MTLIIKKIFVFTGLVLFQFCAFANTEVSGIIEATFPETNTVIIDGDNYVLPVDSFEEYYFESGDALIIYLNEDGSVKDFDFDLIDVSDDNDVVE